MHCLTGGPASVYMMRYRLLYSHTLKNEVMTDNNYDEIIELLCDRLSSLTNTDTNITAETNLISGLSIDSIKLLNLIMEIEDAFDISIPINALADVQTVHELASLISKIKSAS